MSLLSLLFVKFPLFIYLKFKIIRILTMGRDVTKSARRVVLHMFFFHFVSQEELIGSKVVLLSCTKLIVEGKLLVCDFLTNLRKWS